MKGIGAVMRSSHSGTAIVAVPLRNLEEVYICVLITKQYREKKPDTSSTLIFNTLYVYLYLTFIFDNSECIHVTKSNTQSQVLLYVFL